MKINGQKGFTLIECAAALAIFSFCILGIVGLLYNAVLAHNLAKEQHVSSQIMVEILSQTQTTDAAKITELNNKIQTFDYDGLATQNSDFVVYQSRLELIKESRSMYRVIVHVTKRQDLNFYRVGTLWVTTVD